MRQNRAELALLRGKTSPTAVERFTEAFGEGDRKVTARYREIFERLFGAPAATGGYAPYIGRYSPRTREGYSHAVEEFFEWVLRARGRLVLPRDVSRKDAEDYVEWLATRPYSLEKEKLRDGDRDDRLAIYEAVEGLARADIESIRGAVEKRRGKAVDRSILHHDLGRMVLHGLLVRSPTIAELRKENPEIGIRVFTVSVGDRVIPIEDVFVYRLPAPRALARSTIATRLAALSRFWTELCRGDAGEAPLVRHNPFDELGTRVRRGLFAEERARRQRKPRLTPALVSRLVRAADGTRLVEKRDAAVFWFMVLTGVRAREALQIRREKPAPTELERSPGWMEPAALPVMVEMIRKGGVHHRIPYPPYALRALHAFEADLARHAAPHGSQSTDPKSPGYLPPTHSAWRYKALSEQPSAPIFPPLVFWGANSPANFEAFRPNGPLDYERPMTAAGLRAILKRIAKRAGLTKEEARLVHSHAFRHFAATAMDRGGKPIREIQAVLGHSSVQTTERYVAPETTPEVLSGQSEILDYIEHGEGARRPAPAPERPAVIETYGVEPPEEAPVAPGETPGLVAESPVPEAQESAPEGLVALAGPVTPPHVTELKEGLSPGSPLYAYADLAARPGTEAGELRETIHFTRAVPRGKGAPGKAKLYERDGKVMVQGDPFLADHYDPFPLGYGLGETSLLPWFARGPASKSGEVKVEVRDARTGEKKMVPVPPLPVFAAEQLYSEVKAPTLWARVEALRGEWLRTSPTKAFGLDRWWGAFQALQRGLSRGTDGRFRVVPFESVATVGKDIRAHDDDYLAAWLEKNASRYTTTVRAFESIERPRGTERDSEEWEKFRETFNQAALVGVSPAEELPEWFMVDDPVKDIFDHDPGEFEWFVKWIGAITGQKLTSRRKEDREEAVHYYEEEHESRIEEARELLGSYFESVEALHHATRARETDEAERERETMKLVTARLAELGVPDPAKRSGLPRSLDARVDTLLAGAFPKADVSLVDPNVLESALFDKESFRIDRYRHTIVHTEAFRKDFAVRYDGRDSECVLRRAARGMWEHVKRHGIPIHRSTARASEYSLLYSVMLSYIAWIVPCPEVIERRMAEATKGDVTGEAARLRYLTGYRKSVVRILREESAGENELRQIAKEEGLDDQGADEVLESALVQDSLRAEIALPSPPVAEAMARAAVTTGHVEVVSRRPALVVARAPGRARVIEAPRAPVTYFSVGPEPDESEELLPNAQPMRYLTPNAFREGMGSIERASSVMPSALRMMTAMTLAF